MLGEIFADIFGTSTDPPEVKSAKPAKPTRIESDLVQLLKKQRPEDIPPPNKPITVAIIGAGARYHYWSSESKKTTKRISH